MNKIINLQKYSEHWVIREGKQERAIELLLQWGDRGTYDDFGKLTDQGDTLDIEELKHVFNWKSPQAAINRLVKKGAINFDGRFITMKNEKSFCTSCRKWVFDYEIDEHMKDEHHWTSEPVLKHNRYDLMFKKTETPEPENHQYEFLGNGEYENTFKVKCKRCGDIKTLYGDQYHEKKCDPFYGNIFIDNPEDEIMNVRIGSNDEYKQMTKEQLENFIKENKGK